MGTRETYFLAVEVQVDTWGRHFRELSPRAEKEEARRLFLGTRATYELVNSRLHALKNCDSKNWEACEVALEDAMSSMRTSLRLFESHLELAAGAYSASRPVGVTECSVLDT